MIKQWEEFPLTPGTRQATWPRISMTPRGIISINRLAHKHLGQPHSAALFFDKINGLIGLRACPREARNAFPLIQQAKSGSYIIRAKKFCNYYRIRLDHTVVFNDIETEEDGMIVLNLRTTTEYVRRAKVTVTNDGSNLQRQR